MRAFTSVLFGITLLATSVFANPDVAGGPSTPKQKYDYQSDVARLRKIVINSLYSHRDVFLRELISNANDALEKLRLTALTEREVLEGAENLNITVKAVKSEDGPGRIIITDTGIGMTPEELTQNLGTLAKSGTTEFLQKAESSTDTSGTGNLIGAFGLGFYSSFLVADHVYVASIAAKSSRNPEPVQHIFSSSADDSSFEVYPDPRGNTLGRGTEITLVLKDDALDYLETFRLTDMINKHSSFSSSFPVYLFTQRLETVPDDEEETATTTASEEVATPSIQSESDEDEVVIEEAAEPLQEKTEKNLKTKTVTVDEWVQMNAQAPIWTRDPKSITDEEYEAFYSATWKDHDKPLAWHHFTGDSGSGVSFRAIIYIPSRLDESYWREGLEGSNKDLRLMVKRTFITNSLGEDALPKWASWVKVVVDAEDLPLNVSRETLQSNKFLKQLKSIIIRRLLQTLTRIQEEDNEKFEKLQEVYGNVFRLGAVEDVKNRDKLATLCRFPTTQRNSTSLDEYLENKKQGQKQIFYLADMGKSEADLAKSVFVEKLHARGYEVFLFGQPLDEVFVQNLRRWKKVPFQDVAKAGLKFGDEETDPEEEKALQRQLTEEYKPLLDWLRKESTDIVRDVIISNRLVTSSCAIVADAHGYTANIEKMMSANNNPTKGLMHEFAKKQKILEINPRSPLIEGLLKRVKQLPTEEEERDLDAEDELKEVTSVLIDGALVRSGFGVNDSNEFFSRVDRILRRSLGVSETAPTDTSVKPAPPIDPELPTEDEPEEDPLRLFKPREEVKWEVEEIDDEGNPVNPPTSHHDEL
ncbi:heat shock protein Hsp90 [Cristinia sonorae]|uniref:Heat shock protein Hsp90 n=1 Tax=Cristinia sonorae TaxID=1940300 RepID=A0A8K0UWZ9_9AGAR|nr:heat shock protein Hsp90 [Cristinia sonorae]